MGINRRISSYIIVFLRISPSLSISLHESYGVTGDITLRTSCWWSRSVTTDGSSSAHVARAPPVRRLQPTAAVELRVEGRVGHGRKGQKRRPSRPRARLHLAERPRRAPDVVQDEIIIHHHPSTCGPVCGYFVPHFHTILDNNSMYGYIVLI